MMGIFLVFIAFILLRFFFNCPNKVWNRLTLIERTIFSHSQQIIYWGLLIAGLLLCFLAAIKIGFVTLGCFLFFYNISVSPDSLGRMKRIPILGNSLAGLIGIILLIIGLILSFLTSLKYGFISLAGVLSSFLILRVLMLIEIKLMKNRLINR